MQPDVYQPFGELTAELQLPGPKGALTFDAHLRIVHDVRYNSPRQRTLYSRISVIVAALACWRNGCGYIDQPSDQLVKAARAAGLTHLLYPQLQVAQRRAGSPGRQGVAAAPDQELALPKPHKPRPYKPVQSRTLSEWMRQWKIMLPKGLLPSLAVHLEGQHNLSWRKSPSWPHVRLYHGELLIAAIKECNSSSDFDCRRHSTTTATIIAELPMPKSTTAPLDRTMPEQKAGPTTSLGHRHSTPELPPPLPAAGGPPSPPAALGHGRLILSFPEAPIPLAVEWTGWLKRHLTEEHGLQHDSSLIEIEALLRLCQSLHPAMIVPFDL